MRSSFCLVCLLLFVGIMPLSADAAFQSGNKLKADIYGSSADRMFALGYVVGVTEVLVDESHVCLANGVTQGQLLDVVKKYFEANPESLHRSAYLLVYLALKNTWPCAAKSAPNTPSPSPPRQKPRPSASDTSPF